MTNLTFMSRSTAAKRREYLVNYRAVTSRQSFALSNVVTDPDDTERLKAFAKTVGTDGKTSEREAVRQRARELLDDVGRPASDLEDVQEKSYQIVGQLTIEEERLAPNNCA